MQILKVLVDLLGQDSDEVCFLLSICHLFLGEAVVYFCL